MVATDTFKQPEIFRCSSCLKESGIVSRYQVRFFACPSCGSTYQRVDGLFLQQQHIFHTVNDQQNYLQLMDEAVIHGYRYVLTGWMVRKETGGPYYWREYHLFHPAKGYMVLSEYDGHWILLEQLKIFPKDPKKALSLLYDRKAYRLYNSYKAKVEFAAGEFCFDILGDTGTRIMEYVAPPFMISSERSDREMSWYAGYHVEPSDVKRIFRKKDNPPVRNGVGAVQVQKSWVNMDLLKTLTVGYILLLLLTQMMMTWLCADTTVFEERVQVESATDWRNPVGTSDFTVVDSASQQVSSLHVPGLSEPPVRPGSRQFVSRTFELLKGGQNIEIISSADLSNNWLELEIALVNESNGKVYNINQSIEYYSGYDGGERWSEGDRSDETLLSSIDPGKYHLEVLNYHAELYYPGEYSISVKRDVPMWSNFFVALLAGLIIPLFIFWRHQQFEARRWQNSNYA